MAIGIARFAAPIAALLAVAAPAIDSALAQTKAGGVVAGSLGSHDLMQELVKDVVGNMNAGPGASKISLSGTGSWTSGVKFTDPLDFKQGQTPSDFDIITRVAPGTSREEAMQAWKETQRQTEAAIRQKFGRTDAETILKKTNVYPPQMLMEGTRNPKEAMEKFKQLGALPSLARNDPSKLSAAELKEASEGLWGKDGERYRQDYEKKKGKTWYLDQAPDPANPGKTKSAVRATRLMDLDHLAEGAGKYTAQGSAELSQQFADKAMLYLKQGDPRQAIKNLQRLQAEREILFNKAGVGRWTEDFGGAMKDLAAAKSGSEAAQKAEREILKGLQRINYQNQLLLEAAQAKGPSKAMYYGLLRTTEKVFNMAEDLYAKLPPGTAQKLANALDGMFVGADLYEAAKAHAAGDREGMLKALGLSTIGALGLGPAFVAAIGDAVLESAREAGYDLAARREDCWLLLGGISRKQGEIKEARGAGSLEALLINYPDEEKVQGLIQRAAREVWPDDAKGESTQARICTDEIVGRWKSARAAYERQFHQIKRATVAQAFLIRVKSRPRMSDASDTYRVSTVPGEKSAPFAAVLAFGEVTPEVLAQRYAHVQRFLPDKLGTKPLRVIYEWRLDGNLLNCGGAECAIAPAPIGRHQIEAGIGFGNVPGDDNFGIVEESRRLAYAEVTAGLSVKLSGPSRVQLTGREDSDQPVKIPLKVKVAGGLPPYRGALSDKGEELWRGELDADDEFTFTTGPVPGRKTLTLAALDRYGDKANTVYQLELLPPKLALTMSLPDRGKLGEKVVFGLRIEGGTPPYRLRFSDDKSGDPREVADVTQTNFAIDFTLERAGKETLTAVVTDKVGATAQAQRTIDVEGISVRLVGPATLEFGQQAPIVIRVDGGEPPFDVLVNGESKGRMTSRADGIAYTAGNQPQLVRVHVAVRDRNGAVAQSEHILQVAGMALAFTGPSVMLPGQRATFAFSVEGGEPPFEVFVDGRPMGVLDTRSGSMPFQAGAGPSLRRFDVRVRDHSGREAQARHQVQILGAVAEPHHFTIQRLPEKRSSAPSAPSGKCVGKC